jgi:flagellar protein FliO/FliZ
MASIGAQQATREPLPAPSAASANVAATPVDESKLTFDAKANQSLTKRTGAPGIMDFIQMILVLALVVGAIYGIFAFVKRVRKNGPTETESLRILAQTSLSQGRNLYVVQAGSRAFLLGSADGGISLITEIDEKEYLDKLALEAATAPAQGKMDFASVLQTVFPQKGDKADKKKSSGLFPADKFGLLRGQKDRLKKM